MHRIRSLRVVVQEEETMSAIPAMDPASGLDPVDFAQIGPQVGEPFPDMVLPDQHGDPIDLHEHRAGRRAIVAFHRSADW
jgi:hypothetical protein